MNALDASYSIESVTIRPALGWNNGQPGGKKYWVIYVNGNEKQPWVSDSLDYVMEWMKGLMQ